MNIKETFFSDAKIFHYLHYGLAILLIFIGIKMLLSDILFIPIVFTLGVIFTGLLTAIIASLVIEKRKHV